MAKQKGLTLEDLLKSREAMKKEDISEGATGMRSIAAAVSPSLTPLAQSLGKLQQISDPKAVESVAPIRAADASLSKGIKEVSDSLKTLVRLNRTLNSSIERVNKTLVDQLDYSKLVERRLSKQDEESNEAFRRFLRTMTDDVEASTVNKTTTETVSRDTSTSTSKDKGTKSVPLSGLRRTGNIALGATAGAALGGGLYAMSSDSIKELLGKVGIGPGEATAIGGAIGAAIAADLPLKEMGKAVLALTAGLASLTGSILTLGANVIKMAATTPIIAIPAGIATALLGIFKLSEELSKKFGFVDPMKERDKTVNQMVEEAENQKAADKASARRDLTAERRESSAVISKPATGPSVQATPYVTPERAEQVREITKDTADIPEAKAQEILGPVPNIGPESKKTRAQTWKSLPPEERQAAINSAMRDAKRQGRVLDLTVAEPQFSPLSQQYNERVINEINTVNEVAKAQAALSPRLSTLNTASQEYSNIFGKAQQTPMVIRGGDTINNVTNVAGGGGGSAGVGSPSIPFNGWDPLTIGRRGRPYPGWGGP